MWREPDLLHVPVDGGALTVGRWGSGGTVVLGSHGITANHRAFAALAAVLQEQGADVSVYAVDHRGRGGSAAHPGPYGLRTHADDLAAVLDHVGAERAVPVGHSMGAFVVAQAAQAHPDRFPALVLIDGALPIAVDLPADADIEALVRSVIGPALERLDRRFATPEDYLDFWRAHPAFQGENWTDVAEAYFRYDLVADADGWRSGVSKAATLADGADTLTDEQVRTALTRIRQPATVLWAQRGMLDQEPGLYPPAVVEETTRDLDHVSTVAVRGVNHYSILLNARGARAVADAVLGACARVR